MSHSCSLRANSVGGASKLPRLRPHVNKRAQQIIAEHLNSIQSSASSSAVWTASTVPVLTLIESTAPRSARTHDISHLCDKSGHLTPAIPPSLIREEDHKYEAHFLPTDTNSVYSEVDGMWHTKVFPSDTPSSRKDAEMLDAWITRALKRHQESSVQMHTRSDGSLGGKEKKDDLVQTVEALIPILSVALHEVVRQVTYQCSERGVALDKIWRTYVELFHRVLRQMQQSMRDQKQRTLETQSSLNDVKEELSGLRRSHPAHMHDVIANLEETFRSKQKEHEEDLVNLEHENTTLKTDMRANHRELEIWYPNFSQYQDSYIKNKIPHNLHRRATRMERMDRLKSLRFESSASFGPVMSVRSTKTDKTEFAAEESDDPDDEVPPEVAIAEDFKRLLAVLPPDKRRLIGQELGPIIDVNNEKQGQQGKNAKKKKPRMRVETGEEQAELKQLQDEVKKQEDRIRELREEICRVEMAKVAAAEADEKAAVAAAAAEKRGFIRGEADQGAAGDEDAPPGVSFELGLDMLRMAKERPEAIKFKSKVIDRQDTEGKEANREDEEQESDSDVSD